ncbi:MAG: hypothetical protein Q7L07_15335, partial [Pseudohongiella sp.]|nr:hypothetical protein [Pseudohongiella sp.]
MYFQSFGIQCKNIFESMGQSSILSVLVSIFVAGCVATPQLDDAHLAQTYVDAGPSLDIVESRGGLHCRIFHPRAWLEPGAEAARGQQHPLVIWGNGTYASPAS